MNLNKAKKNFLVDLPDFFFSDLVGGDFFF